MKRRKSQEISGGLNMFCGYLTLRIYPSRSKNQKAKNWLSYIFCDAFLAVDLLFYFGSQFNFVHAGTNILNGKNKMQTLENKTEKKI